MILDRLDTAQLEEFLAEAQPVLERALVARLGMHDGLDAASDAVEYAYANWDRLKEMRNPLGYLFRVGQSRGRRASQLAGRTDRLVTEPATTDRLGDVDLQRALMRLRWEQRVVIVLIHAHGYSYADAAQATDLPTTTVANHLTRGLARLRRILEP